MVLTLGRNIVKSIKTFDWKALADAVRAAAAKIQIAREAAKPKRYNLVFGELVEDKDGELFYYEDHLKLLTEAVRDARITGYDDGKSSNHSWRL